MSELAAPKIAVSNGLPPPNLDLQYPEDASTITENLLKLNELNPHARQKFIFSKLITHLHQFIREVEPTTDEWMNTLNYLTRVGQTCTPVRQEFILLSDVLGVSALVDAINSPDRTDGATQSSVFGPFFTEDAPDVDPGESIASEGRGEYMYVEGRVLSTDGKPIEGAVIETWEADHNGFYDVQYADRDRADCRGRLRTGKDGKYNYRAIVPHAYPIPGDGPVGDLLTMTGRHNMRPNHLHLMVEAPGYRKLTTAVYPEGDEYLKSDPVFGVKKSLLVKLEDVNDDGEARRLGFPKGGPFKRLEFDIVLAKEQE